MCPAADSSAPLRLTDDHGLYFGSGFLCYSPLSDRAWEKRLVLRFTTLQFLFLLSQAGFYWPLYLRNLLTGRALSSVSYGAAEGLTKLFSAAFQMLKKLTVLGGPWGRTEVWGFCFSSSYRYFFFPSIFLSSSTNSLRLERPKVKFVLILNLPLWLPCNFHSMA